MYWVLNLVAEVSHGTYCRKALCQVVAEPPQMFPPVLQETLLPPFPEDF